MAIMATTTTPSIQPATWSPFNSYRNESKVLSLELITGDDAAWSISCAFLILTMQTGFAMLECGFVSAKNCASIVMKNICDVILGGLTYWVFGYGITFGETSNPFMGLSGFFFKHDDFNTMGTSYAHYFFQLSFATTATTIVSGAVAERMKLHAYMVFSLLNTIVYCFPANWAWGKQGFLGQLGFYDFAGVCVVHLCGGACSIVAAYMLGPRTGRFERPHEFEMSSPVTCLSGMFMLWWAWLGFNCGSTFGIGGSLWKVSAMVAVTTTNGAIGGGLAGLVLTMWLNKKKIIVDDMVNSCLGGLVSITGIASVITPHESLIVGMVGGLVAICGSWILIRMKIDDPVSCVSVHLFAAVWGTISIGIFGKDNIAGQMNGRNGLFHGGGFYLLGVQCLGAFVTFTWAAVLTYAILKIIDVFMGIRISLEHERLGLDYVDHDLYSSGLTNKFLGALAAIDDDKIDGTLQKVVNQLQDTSKPRRKLSGRQRVFGMDIPISALEDKTPRSQSPADKNDDARNTVPDRSSRSNSNVWVTSNSLAPPGAIELSTVKNDGLKRRKPLSDCELAETLPV